MMLRLFATWRELRGICLRFFILFLVIFLLIKGEGYSYRQGAMKVKTEDLVGLYSTACGSGKRFTSAVVDFLKVHGVEFVYATVYWDGDDALKDTLPDDAYGFCEMYIHFPEDAEGTIKKPSVAKTFARLCDKGFGGRDSCWSLRPEEPDKDGWTWFESE